MLEVVAQRKGGATDSYVILCTGYRRGSVTSYGSLLKSRGLITREGSRSFATARGFEVLPKSFKKLPTGKKLVEHMIDTLPPGEALVLKLLLEEHPTKLTLQDILQRTKRPSGSITSYLSHLRTREVVAKGVPGGFVEFNTELRL